MWLGVAPHLHHIRTASRGRSVVAPDNGYRVLAASSSKPAGTESTWRSFTRLRSQVRVLLRPPGRCGPLWWAVGWRDRRGSRRSSLSGSGVGVEDVDVDLESSRLSLPDHDVLAGISRTGRTGGDTDLDCELSGLG